MVTALCLCIGTINESELQELVMMMPPRFIDQEIKYKLNTDWFLQLLALVPMGLCDMERVPCTGVFMGLGLSLLKPLGVRARGCSPELLCVFIVILTLEQDLS